MALPTRAVMDQGSSSATRFMVPTTKTACAGAMNLGGRAPRAAAVAIGGRSADPIPARA
jgi:hypothetical protein